MCNNILDFTNYLTSKTPVVLDVYTLPFQNDPVFGLKFYLNPCNESLLKEDSPSWHLILHKEGSFFRHISGESEYCDLYLDVNNSDKDTIIIRGHNSKIYSLCMKLEIKYHMNTFIALLYTGVKETKHSLLDFKNVYAIEKILISNI